MRLKSYVRRVYVTPEMMFPGGGGEPNPLFQSLASHGKLFLVAIDEAHCVSAGSHSGMYITRKLVQVVARPSILSIRRRSLGA